MDIANVKERLLAIAPELDPSWKNCRELLQKELEWMKEYEAMAYESRLLGYEDPFDDRYDAYLKMIKASITLFDIH